jgi:predicted CXXCH cytochrome family protein
MHRDRRRPLPVTCLAAVAVLTIMLAAGIASSPPPVKAPASAPNPHWSPAGCRECHGPGTPTRADFTPMKIEKLCTGCHEARRAPKPVHPSYRPITGDQLRRPAGWPLLGNRVGCITCHEVLAGCRPNIRRPAYNSVFLRGYDGRDLGRFCNNCHVRAAEAERFSPHLMLDEDAKIVPSACTYCHSGVPKLELTGQADPQTVKLRHGEAALCMGCHTRHLDYFEPGHIGRKVPAGMKAYMATTEARRLRLAAGDRVTCTTCHNPHQQGVFPPGSAEARGAIRPGDSRRNLGLRLAHTELCCACHRK